MHIVAWLLIGLAAGAVARLLVPGAQPLGLIGTLLLGLAGSLLGGWLYTAVEEGPARITPAGLLWSILGAIVVLLVLRLMSGRRRVL